MPTQRENLVFSGNSPVRLDKFLADYFHGISRAYIQDLITKEFVKVNGSKVRKAYTLHCGDKIGIEPFSRPEERQIDPNPNIPLHLVWQSPDLIVIEKQAGLPTHPNDFSDQNTLANALAARFPSLLQVGEDPLRPGIVHRLDTDTSGLLLVARTPNAFIYLRKLFDTRKIKKTYLALVLGDLEKAGKITTPVAHHPSNPRKMIAVKNEKDAYRSKLREAQTHYEIIERFGNYTLLKVHTLTGRMHQVRVHLGSVGHPLAGDRIYQTQAERRQDKTSLNRHFLHATKLELPIPPDQTVQIFESPLPRDLEQFITKLRNPS